MSGFKYQEFLTSVPSLPFEGKVQNLHFTVVLIDKNNYFWDCFVRRSPRLKNSHVSKYYFTCTLLIQGQAFSCYHKLGLCNPFPHSCLYVKANEKCTKQLGFLSGCHQCLPFLLKSSTTLCLITRLWLTQQRHLLSLGA